MAGFFGFRTVLADLRKHRGTGKVTSTGTLKVRTADGADSFTNVTWGNLYIWPDDEVSGLGAGGHPDLTVRITLWRIGETSRPRPDDKLTIGSDSYLIQRATSRLNADESSNYAVYDCDTVRN